MDFGTLTDFTLVSVHIAAGSRLHYVGLAVRKCEIEELVAFMKREAARTQGSVSDPDFSLVGDFNLQADGDLFFQVPSRGSKCRRA